MDRKKNTTSKKTIAQQFFLVINWPQAMYRSSRDFLGLSQENPRNPRFSQLHLVIKGQTFKMSPIVGSTGVLSDRNTRLTALYLVQI